MGTAGSLFLPRSARHRGKVAVAPSADALGDPAAALRRRALVPGSPDGAGAAAGGHGCEPTSPPEVVNNERPRRAARRVVDLDGRRLEPGAASEANELEVDRRVFARPQVLGKCADAQERPTVIGAVAGRPVDLAGGTPGKGGAVVQEVGGPSGGGLGAVHRRRRHHRVAAQVGAAPSLERTRKQGHVGPGERHDVASGGRKAGVAGSPGEHGIGQLNKSDVREERTHDVGGRGTPAHYGDHLEVFIGLLFDDCLETLADDALVVARDHNGGQGRSGVGGVGGGCIA